MTRPHPPALPHPGPTGLGDAPMAAPHEGGPATIRRPSADGLGYLVATMRWCGVAIGLVISGANGDLGRPSTIAAGLLVTSGSLWYTLWPLRLAANRPLAVAAFASDLAVTAVAVAMTGGWTSPFVLLVLASVLVAGFDRGYVSGFVVVGACTGAVALPPLLGTPGAVHVGIDVAAPVVLVLIATAAVAGYAHRLFVEADQHHHETTGELLRLAQFNQQLLVLYQMAQTLPASLDLDETLEEARRHLDEAVELDVFAVLTTDESGSGWTVAASAGATLPERLTEAALPSAARAALQEPAGLLVDDLGTPERGPGLDPRSRTAVYVGLRAGGRVVGLLAVERRRPVAFTVPALRLVHGIADSLSLGIENARWFRRLRALGAEEERTRIARELHDRLAQSLVYLGYELDRLVKRREHDDELARLRDDVRHTVTELRETLVQLRSTVNAEHSLEVHVRQLAERFARRTGVAVDLELRPVTPLPPARGPGGPAHRPGGAEQRRAPRRRQPGRHRLVDGPRPGPRRRRGRRPRLRPRQHRPPLRRLRAHRDVRACRCDRCPPARRAPRARRDPRGARDRRPPRRTGRPGPTPDRAHRPLAPGARTMTRILLVDDHQLLRHGLRRTLEDAGFEVVGEAGDGDAAVWMTETLDPDLVLMDVSMPVLDGIEAARRIHRRDPRQAVLMLTMHADAETAGRALAAGAIGYLVKDSTSDEVVQAVALAVDGETVVSPDVAAAMLAEAGHLVDESALVRHRAAWSPDPNRAASGEAATATAVAAPADVDGILSRRERQVLEAIASGLTTKEAARQLFISVKTVKNHLASIYEKLDARDRTQAILGAARLGIIRLPQ